MIVQLLFWLSVTLIVYTFFGYPLLITFLARQFPRPNHQAPITPTVTIIIPAYNEETEIRQKLENTLSLDYPVDQYEIVVVADGSTDKTAEIVQEYIPKGVRLYYQPERQGKTAAINRVVPHLTSDILVFTDANTTLPPHALRTLVRHFADPKVGGVAGEKRVSGGGEGLYWRYESWLKRCDSTISSVMGAAGELFAVRRTAFSPPPNDSLLDDFIISLTLVADGWRVVYEPEAFALENPTPSLAGEWQRRTRNGAGGFQAIWRLRRLLHPRYGRVMWQYFSHRFVRWAITPFLLPVAYVLNGLLWPRPFYRPLFILQTLFYLTALVGYWLNRHGRNRRLPFIAFYFCFTNLAAIVGFWRYITRRQPVTWVKVR
ncbi:MAG: glycosyltransferase family 2 protein [Chloroflexi bacterium]|nr:MAG: glycosyltransferase family 2 protein [Chloroflexota bacterium]